MAFRPVTAMALRFMADLNPRVAGEHPVVVQQLEKLFDVSREIRARDIERILEAGDEPIPVEPFLETAEEAEG